MKRKILLVDDEINILKALERMLRRAGYDVFTANSAAEGLQLQSQQHCPVVISDFRMPEQNGAEFLRLLQQVSPGSVGMILSAYADFQSVVETLNSGVAFKFLQKPWLEASLLADIELAWQKYQQQKNQQLRTGLLIDGKDAMLELTVSGALLRFNAAATQLLNLTAAELTGSGIQQIFQPIPAEMLNALWQQQLLSLTVETIQGIELELNYQFNDSEVLLVRLEPVHHQSNLTSQFSDMSQVLDRTQLLAAIDQALILSTQPIAIVYLDVQNFTDIHYAIGYSGADALVAKLGKDLLERSQPYGQLAYLYADQFVLLLHRYGQEAMIPELLQQMLADYAQPFILQDKALHLRFNLGYCLAPADGRDSRILLDQARQAARCHIASEHHLALRFDQNYADARRQHYDISNALFDAISRKAFSLNFQPKVQLDDGRIHSAEVLIRWSDEQLGSISPAVFIPIAERDGQIHAIGQWVMSESIRTLVSWRAQFPQLRQLSVNVSGAQLTDSRFIPALTALLQQSDLPPQMLEIELTETVALNNLTACAAVLAQLQQLGIQVAIDDFGTGYSSLAYLTRLPVDVVKLDRSLILDLEYSLPAQSMLRNLIRMTHDLNIKVVAEGVESTAQLDLLKQMHCDVVQGYIYSKPLAEQSFLQMITTQPFLQADHEEHP